ncbi:MAG: hypothetical protein AAF899_07995, partial [Pseudomonadota bacterium]
MPPRTRRGMVLGASGAALAMALVFTPMPAFSQACGAPAGSPPSVSCSPADNVFPDGIVYTVDDLTVVLEDGVTVVTDPGVLSGVELREASDGYIYVLSDNQADTITVQADGGTGVYLEASDGITAILPEIYVTGAGATGIIAIGDDDGDIDIDFAGVTANGAGSDGVYVVGEDGDIRVTGDSVVADDVGAFVYSEDGGDVYVDVDDVTSGDRNIDASSDGGRVSASSDTGSIYVEVTDVETDGIGEAGASARSFSGNAYVLQGDAGDDIETSGNYANAAEASSFTGAAAANVSNVATEGRYSDGVSVLGGAGATVTVTGDVYTSGYASRGVRAGSGSGAVDVTVDTVTTTGERGTGIEVTSDAAGTAGAITVVAGDAVVTEGPDADGVYAVATGGLISLDVQDVTVSGAGSNAIYARASSETGAIVSPGNFDYNNYITIVAGDVTASNGGGTAGDGIDALAYGGAVDITVGDVTADEDGIVAISDATRNGVYQTASGGVTVSAGAVTAGAAGIVTQAYSDIGYYGGDLSVGAESVDAGTGDAVSALSSNSDVDVTIDETVSSTGGRGVYAVTGIGAGPTETTGNVSVQVLNDEGEAVAVTSAGDGVTAITTGYDPGFSNVLVEGDVDAGGAGVTAIAGDGASDDSGTATARVYGAVTAGTGDGVYVYSRYDDAYAYVSGDVSSTDGSGVVVGSYLGSASAYIGGDVDGAGYGIDATAGGSGSVYVEAGNVTSRSTTGQAAVEATAYGAGDVSVDVGDVIAASGNGVYAAANLGAEPVDGGYVTVEAGSVDAGGYGVVALSQGTTGGDVTVRTDGAVVAEDDGIIALSFAGDDNAGGTVLVYAYGDVTSTNEDGIEAYTAGGDIGIYADGTTTGGDDGIYAFSGEDDGTGSGTVIVVAGPTTEGTGDDGIEAYGSGYVSVTAGAVIGADGDGVYARSRFDNVNIDIASASGGDDGIQGVAYYGDVTVMTTGNVDGYGSNGIEVDAGYNVIVDVGGDVYGYDDGIEVDSNVGGTVDIDVYGAVTANYDQGIDVYNNGGNVYVDVGGPIDAYGDGVFVDTDNGGNIEVIVRDDISATYGDGVYANNFGGGDDSTIDITVYGDISAYSDGVYATSYDGDINVRVEGSIYAETDDGIDVYSYTGDIDIDVVVGEGAPYAIDAADEGIYAYIYDGAGTIDIDVNGYVYGGNFGIYANSDEGDITIDAAGAGGGSGDG